MKKPVKKIKMKGRIFLLFIIFILLLIGLIVRVAYISIVEKQNYQTNVLAQHVSSETSADEIPAKRGTITDRNGIVLAESIKVYNVIYDPGVLNQYDEAIKQATNTLISSTLDDVSIGELTDILLNDPNSNYKVIKKGATHEEVLPIEQAIASKSVKGVFLESYYKRMYPYNTLGSDVLGFYGTTTGGRYGVEEYYDTFLSGKHGRLFGYLDNGSIVRQEEISPQDGKNIVLTIDYTIQKMVEESLSAFFVENKAKSANVIIMDPNNGEVLAMASYPSFDLNDPYGLSHIYAEEELKAMSQQEQTDELYDLWNNFNIFNSYEPGSTFKPFVLAAALEEDKTYLDQMFTCYGHKVVADRIIHCWKTSGHGLQTASEGLANSCNVVFMEIGEALGRDLFFQYQMMFGFSAKTNVDLIGEGNSILYPYDRLNITELATSSFGQGFNITPLQLINAFSSLINGGFLYEPHIMKQVEDSEGKLVERNGLHLQRQVISPEVSGQITAELETVVEGGTGKGAAIEGYRIGGKTGTAEKGNRLDDKYIISFIGFAPVNAPKLIALVIVDEPDVADPNSGLTSMLYAEIMAKVLPYYGVFSDAPVVETTEGDGDSASSPEAPVQNTTLEIPETTTVESVESEETVVEVENPTIDQAIDEEIEAEVVLDSPEVLEESLDSNIQSPSENISDDTSEDVQPGLVDEDGGNGLDIPEVTTVTPGE